MKIIITILFFFLWYGQAFASAPTNGLVGYWNFDEGSGALSFEKW